MLPLHHDKLYTLQLRHRILQSRCDTAGAQVFLACAPIITKYKHPGRGWMEVVTYLPNQGVTRRLGLLSRHRCVAPSFVLESSRLEAIGT
jgi:hypothetical protein